jgi:hypothetical protein
LLGWLRYWPLPPICSCLRGGSGERKQTEVSKMRGDDALQFSVRAVLARHGVDLEILAGHCTSQPSRCAANRYHSILCRIGGDARKLQKAIAEANGFSVAAE